MPLFRDRPEPWRPVGRREERADEAVNDQDNVEAIVCFGSLPAPRPSPLDLPPLLAEATFPLVVVPR